MKTLENQVNELSYKNKESASLKSLEAALKEYHSMIESGKLVPRGNRIGSLQNNIANYYTKKTNIR